MKRSLGRGLCVCMRERLLISELRLASTMSLGWWEVGTGIRMFQTFKLTLWWERSSCLWGRFSSVQLLSSVQLFATPWTATQHAMPPCPSPTPRVYSNSCPLSRWWHPTTSSSVIPFSSYLQSFPASESFPMGQFISSGGQSTGVSASAVLPMNSQDWLPLGWTGWISWQSKGLLRVFFNILLQKHQFFGAQISL